MIDLANLAEAIAVVSACVAVISGIGAWKREFIGKRRIELAEELLAKYFEVKDAIAFIRNPYANANEGKSRKRGPHESREESELLDRAYVVVERYQQREHVFADFNTMKYRCMASFGADTERVFAQTNRVLDSIFSSARILATHFWPRQGRAQMSREEFAQHLAEMEKHEAIFWEYFREDDEIRADLLSIQASLEEITAPCFKEPLGRFSGIRNWWR